MSHKKNYKQASLVIQGRSLTYFVRHSKKAKNMLIRLKDNGDIEVVIPWYVAYRSAHIFVAQQKDWIAHILRQKRKQQNNVSRRMITGALLPVFGDVRQLEIKIDSNKKRNSYQENKDSLQVKANNLTAVEKVVVRWYKKRAEIYFTKQVSLIASQMSVQISKLAISNAKSQWGSCIKKTGRISLNWRLALAPLAITDYVIVHELAHLTIMNHSPCFWELVRTHCPHFQQYRQWLKTNQPNMILFNKSNQTKTPT